MITPASIEEFNSAIKAIDEKIGTALDAKWPDFVTRIGIDSEGNLKGPCAIGSCVIYADGRSSLGRFLKALCTFESEDFRVYENGHAISISLKSLSFQQYLPKKFGYSILVEELRELYGWEIFNDVRLD